jgi:CheY-like chemotaxis protein
VLVNLLVNAAHAIPEGAAERHQIRVATRTGAGGEAILEVADTGCGIAPQHLPRIFEPFFTTRPQGTGTGLGLWVCRNLVGAVGGDLQVESVPGAGTTFRVILPAAAEQAGASPQEGAPAVAGGRGRVLVVDDDPLVAAVMRRTLAPEHEVVVETSARAALSRLASGERFGAIVCDLMMPEMNGMELHAAVERVSREDGARVVFVTGGAFTPEAQEYLERVRNPRLEKPFAGDALRAAVRGVLERRGGDA